MRTDPTLAARSLPAGTMGYRVPLTFRVEGGLHSLRGDSLPYFSLTYVCHRRGFPQQCYSGGAGHETILKYYPHFADLAALHLSDINGVPMHAEANGWFLLEPAMGDALALYHAGNTKLHIKGEYREPTADECLELFAKHCRIGLDEARRIRDDVRASEHPREQWQTICEGMRPRWKAEAEACIKRHGLRVVGDAWTPEGAKKENPR